MENAHLLKKIHLEKDEKVGFGFSIIGGKGSELPPIIFDVIHNSPADRCSELHIGDVIVEVNGLAVDSLTTRQVVHQLKYARSPLVLLLRCDSDVKHRAEKYLQSSVDDADHLRGAISQEDLIGVNRLIIRSASSSSQQSDDDSDSLCSSPSNSSRGQSPVKVTTRTANRGQSPSSKYCNVTTLTTAKRKVETLLAAEKAYDNQPVMQVNCKTRCFESNYYNNCDIRGMSYDFRASQENGVVYGCDKRRNGALDHNPDLGNEERNSSFPLSPHTPKFETFVMTGDKIIRTSVHPVPAKVDILLDGRKEASADSKSQCIIDAQPSVTSIKHASNPPSHANCNIPSSRASNDEQIAITSQCLSQSASPSRTPASTTVTSTSHSNCTSVSAEVSSSLQSMMPCTLPHELNILASQRSNNLRMTTKASNVSFLSNDDVICIDHSQPRQQPPLSQPSYAFLDIPPDDISTEDERATHTDRPAIDVDLLPPPPDELLDDCAVVSRVSAVSSHHPLISQSTPLLARRESIDDEECETFDTGSEAVLYNSDARSDVLSTDKMDEQTIVDNKTRPPPITAVRCKSHENYLQSSPAYMAAMVDIDLDDNMANSLDQLNYGSERDSIGAMFPQRSSSMENRAPTMLAGEEPRSIVKQREMGYKPTENESTSNDGYTNQECVAKVASMNDLGVGNDKIQNDSTLLESDVITAENDLNGVVESNTKDNTKCLLHHNVPLSNVGDDQFDPYVIAMAPPSKEVDRPSAARLAKRLFNQDGFKRSDISRHLSKTNEFAQFVGEEFVKFFDFSGDSLDVALRKFLDKITLAGETQERERVLGHFSRRYTDCNPNVFNSSDACHTLTCALLLLNTDLHGQNVSRKMTLNEFIYNLADLNDGKNFDTNVLRHLFNAIKSSPLECKYDDERCESGDGGSGMLKSSETPMLSTLNPFLEVPDPSKATEYKKGYVMRKCCLEPGSKKTPFGRRGWKMFYATLRDLILYLHKDESGLRKNTVVYQNMANAIRVHHSLATKATEYKKKQYVFRLRTADGAEYLFQTGNSKECQEWIDSINFVAATLSSPPLPAGVGSQKKFQRPLLPSSHTKLNMLDQLQQDEQQVMRLEADLTDLRRSPPEKGAKLRLIQDFCEKEEYLQFELRRYKTYCFLLQAKMSAFKELSEPSLVEIAIGEVDEPPASPNLSANRSSTGDNVTMRPKENSSPSKSDGDRSLSDRYSYRAAIFNNDFDGS